MVRGSNRFGRGRVTCAVLAGLGFLVIGFAPAAAVRTAAGVFDRTGLDGTGLSVMQPVSVGPLVSRVATVPGADGSAWAIGRSTALIPGWAGVSNGGQVVFLRYQPSTGWVQTGPPVDANGKPASPSLTALALAGNGEGWAVGDNGTLVHLEAGSTTWRIAPRLGDSTLHSVSLITLGRRLYGFAVGDAGTILHLDHGAWGAESPGGTLASTDLVSVAASGPDSAFVTGAIRGQLGDRMLVMGEGSNGSWTQIKTGQAFFDGPRPNTGQQSQETYGTAVGVGSHAAWFAGTIIPQASSSSSGPDPAGDSSRPFVLRYDLHAQSFTSYCPDAYSVGSSGQPTVAPMCDEPIPLSTYDLTAVQVFPHSGEDEVFAAGLGLLHYRGGAWGREPDSVGYLGSLSFANATEGWVAVTGNAIGSGGGGFGSSSTLGHWTASPQMPRMQRWSQPNELSLESIAAAPDGSGRQIAVGLYGGMVTFTPAVGWERFPLTSSLNLHGVAWPAMNQAWAVGQSGTILSYNGAIWNQYPNPDVTSLFAVAFASPDDGVAVGDGGVIMDWNGASWRLDPASRRVTQQALYTVVATGGGFVAAGDEGSVVVRDARGWHAQDLSKLIDRGDSAPTLYASTAAPDGSVWIGGELSTLVRRLPSGAWSIDREGARVPPEGMIIALGALASGELVASISADDLKFESDQPSAATGRVMIGDARGWHDPAFADRARIAPTYDSAAPHDPVYAFARADGTAVWAVGGTPPELEDPNGSSQEQPSSSVYRLDLVGDPSQPAQLGDPGFSAGGVSFAFFGETACGLAVCGPTVGSGAKADVVALQIRDEVNRASELPGGPKFVIFGGNMRRVGIPEELGQFKRYIKGFRIPVFAALGSEDLFAGLGTSSSANVTPANAFYLNTFADMPAPWGHSPTYPNVVPYIDSACARAPSGQAATHYVFDYASNGSKLVRFVFLDDSTGALSSTQSQSPQEDQQLCLNSAVKNAQLIAKIPVIVVMNRPTEDPLAGVPSTTTFADAAGFTASITGTSVSAVLGSYYHENSLYFVPADRVPNNIPTFVNGGGGSPLDGSRESDSGFYHSWMLLRVATEHAPSLTGQKPVEVRSFPVLESLAIHALGGVSTKAGNTLLFSGVGRAPDGGEPNDKTQSRATYINLPQGGLCKPLCALSERLPPDYRFESENPNVGYFVRSDPASENLPYLDVNGNTTPDDTSGLFCAVGTGQTFVDLVSGLHRVRAQVTVDGGFGPCVHKPVPSILRTRKVSVPPYLYFPSAVHKEFLYLGFHNGVNDNLAIIPPPPISVAAPAPPAAPGAGRKEEHELSPEEQRADHEYKFLAHRATDDRAGAELAMGAALILSLFGAAVSARMVRARSAAASEETRRR